MSWLIEIEKHNAVLRKKLDKIYGTQPETDRERMACVIRELVGAIKRIELGCRLDVVIDLLSPDTKEVIEELRK